MDFTRNSHCPGSSIEDVTEMEEEDLPPISLVCWAEFAVNPALLYNLFDYRQGKLHFDPSKVLYLTRDDQEDGSITKDWIFQVSNEIDLAALSAQLITKRILMKSRVVHTKTIHRDGSDRASTWEATLAVLINTNHSTVRRYIDIMIETVSKLLYGKRRFCVMMDFSEVLTTWYNDYLGAMPGCSEHYATRSFNSGIYITNHKTSSRLFDCSPMWCLFCPICWLSSAPCYRAYRKATCVDSRIEVKADVTFVLPSLGDLDT